MVNVDGLISGIDTESIIDGLLEIQKTQLDSLKVRKSGALGKQAALSTLQATMTSLQSSVSKLSRSQNNVFSARSISVSNESSLLATASSGAAKGVYQLRVDSLATAHQVASQSFADADSAITEGTFTVQVGNRPPAEITIDSSNNTLTGLADAINFANAGVSASIIQNGTGTNAQYQLLLTSQETGTDSQIAVTNGLADSNGSAVKPVLDFDAPVQAATNAQIRLGSGAGAITVQSATNQFNNVVGGLSLTVLEADPDRPVQVTVGQDAEQAVTSVQDFVDSFNAVIEQVNELIKYDAGTDTAGVLSGNYTVIQVQNQLRSVVQQIVPGISSQANRLQGVGITFNDKGELVLDEQKLTDVINGKVAGVTGDDLQRLFALGGKTNNPNVEFLLGTSKTKTTNDNTQVVITKAAEQASISGTNPLAASTVIDSSNRSLTLKIDGAEITVTLAEGTYTGQQLANELEDVINAHPDLLGRTAKVGLNASNQLAVTSNAYGGSSEITVLSGSALAALGFQGGESDSGQNVEGHFLVNGEIEPATGRGRLLSAEIGNENTADLQLRVTLSPSQVSSPVTTDLTITRGVAGRVDNFLSEVLDPVLGTFATATKTFTDEADSIQASIDRQQALFDRQQEDLVSQFAALESALSGLQNTSSILASQLGGVSSLKK